MTDPAQPARWAVVCTARESPDLLAAFAAHHLAAGAHEVHLFLDAPDPEAAALLAALPRTHVTICDAAYWSRAKGRRPAARENRQIANAQDAYRRTRADWLAHLDADEFLRSESPLGALLAQVPAGIDFVDLPPFERVYRRGATPATLFDGLFRVPFGKRRRAERAVFGHTRPFTQGGYSGHTRGKSLVRTGRDALLMGIHSPRPLAGATRLVNIAAAGAGVLHFDGLTPLHWLTKLLHYATEARYLDERLLGEARVAQIREAARRRGNPEALRELHDLVKTVDAVEEAQLTTLGFLVDSPFDARPALARFGLADAVDLSAGRLDARLLEACPDLAQGLAA